jgi:hypothetical protein
VFTAQIPQDVDPDKYDVTVASMIALLKYGTGMPFNRQEGLQRSLGIPLPASPQWTIVAEDAPSLRSAHEELIRQGGQADLVYNDDTTNRILERMGKRLDKAEAKKVSAVESATEDEAKTPKRRGIFKSEIVCLCAGHLIALFFTAWKHAGENLRDVFVAESAPAVASNQERSRDQETLRVADAANRRPVARTQLGSGPGHQLHAQPLVRADVLPPPNRGAPGQQPL